MGGQDVTSSEAYNTARVKAEQTVKHMNRSCWGTCIMVFSSFLMLSSFLCLGILVYYMPQISNPPTRDTSSESFVVAAYLAHTHLDGMKFWEMGQPWDLVSARATDLILHSLEPAADGTLNTSRWPANHVRAAVKGKVRHKTRVLVSLGGDGVGTHFAKLVMSAKKRKRFQVSLLDYLRKYNLDGVDFDWKGTSTASWEAYADLIRETKEALAPHSLLVTAAVHPWQVLKHEGFAQADRLHLMMFDGTKEMMTLEGAKRTVMAAMEGGLKDPTRIVLGIPAYGKQMKDRTVVPYLDIIRKNFPMPDVDEVKGIHFNGVKTVGKKADWAREMGLAGVVVWEVGMDTRDSRQSILNTLDRKRNGWIRTPLFLNRTTPLNALGGVFKKWLPVGWIHDRLYPSKPVKESPKSAKASQKSVKDEL